MEISELQRRIEAIYGERDRRRGLYETFAWLVEEVGELARRFAFLGGRLNVPAEAWLATVGRRHRASGAPFARLPPAATIARLIRSP